MATDSQISSHPQGTFERLQTAVKTIDDHEDQISQVASIIGLPDHWNSSELEQTQIKPPPAWIKARGDYVLKYILKKLNDSSGIGEQARASSQSWRLLEWMVFLTPVSPTAVILRDLGFLDALERALQEVAELGTAAKRAILQEGESPEPAEEWEAPPQFRKRKRGSPSQGSPSKRVAIAEAEFTRIGALVSISRALGAIIGKTRPSNIEEQNSEEAAIMAEHMKSVLRTKSDQAARILKYWIVVVHKVLDASLDLQLTNPSAGEYLDLSYPLEIWKAHSTPSLDMSRDSAKVFSGVCLVPVINLIDALSPSSSDQTALSDAQKRFWDIRDKTIYNLEGLLTQHIIVPSRITFFKSNSTNKESKDKSEESSASLDFLLSDLHTKMIEAFELSTATNEYSLSREYKAIFAQVPTLFDLVIKHSPAKTLKARIAERPWIQSAFVSLLECMGFKSKKRECPLDLATAALQKMVALLRLRNIFIDPVLLRSVFLHHTGLEGRTNWELVAEITKANADIFLPPAGIVVPEDEPEDLGELLFEQISSIDRFRPLDDDVDLDGDSEVKDLDGDAEIMDLDISTDRVRVLRGGFESSPGSLAFETRSLIQKDIIIPIMASYARNRDLLGFIERFHRQLCINASVVLWTDSIDRPDGELSIWQDTILTSALATHITSLPQTQLAGLLSKHGDNILTMLSITDSDSPGRSICHQHESEYKAACGSSEILNVLLDSSFSYETIDSVVSQLQQIQHAYIYLAQRGSYRSVSDLALTWEILRKLLEKLWPASMHDSEVSQLGYLSSGILKRAGSDVAHTIDDVDQEYTDSRSRAAATAFLMRAWSYFHTMPGWEDGVSGVANRVMGSLNPETLERSKLPRVLALLITQYGELIRHCDSEYRKAVFQFILDQPIVGELSRAALSDFVASTNSAEIKEDYSTAVGFAVDRVFQRYVERTDPLPSFLHVFPATLSREIRARILDRCTDILSGRPDRNDVDMLLCTIAHFMQVPNASAEISTKSTLLFDMAQSIHDCGVGSEPSTLQAFHNMAKVTLSHIFANPGQSQYLTYTKSLKKSVKAVMSVPVKSDRLRFAIIRAIVATQRDEAIIPWGDYAAFLTSCIDLDVEETSSISSHDLLDAVNEAPPDALRQLGALTGRVNGWVTAKFDVKHWWTSDNTPTTPIDPQTWIRIQTFIAKSHNYADVSKFLNLTMNLLQTDLSITERKIAFDAARTAIESLDNPSKHSIIKFYFRRDKEQRVHGLRIVSLVISTLEDHGREHKTELLNLLPELCRQLYVSSDITTFNVLLDSIETIVREKPNLTTQFGIESVLVAVTTILSPNSPALPNQHASAIFDRLCKIVHSIEVLHRGRLGGRYHLLLNVLKSLVDCLFILPANRVNYKRPAWLRSSTRRGVAPQLTASNATRVARILTTLCNPTTQSLTRSAKKKARSELVDPIKRARVYGSQHVPALLSFFCKCQLSGRLEPEVRERLMQGMWEVMDMARLDMGALRGMSAGMDAATREIWKGDWEEFKRVKGRSGLD